MRTQRGSRGQFSSLYGTSTLRLPAEFPYPPGGPRYERLVFDGEGQLVVPLNEWYRLMQGVGAARTRDTYLALLRPWFGFLAIPDFLPQFIISSATEIMRPRPLFRGLSTA